MRRLSHKFGMLTACSAAVLALTSPSSAQDTFKVGIVTFLSGPAAESFGVPAGKAAEFVIGELNKGAGPAPYNKVGFGGMKIEPVVIDENGGAINKCRNCATSISATMSMR